MSDFELVKKGGEDFLRVAGAGLIALDEVRKYELGRVGLAVAKLFECRSAIMPPYVVAFAFDKEEPDSTTWHAQFLDPKIAFPVRDAIQAELMATDSHNDVTAAIPAFPERFYTVEKVPKFASVAGAMASFRAALVADDNGPVGGGFEYDFWKKIGFTQDEVEALDRCVAEDLFGKVERASNLTAELEEWLNHMRENDYLDETIEDTVDSEVLFDKLRRWCRGELLVRTPGTSEV